MTGVDPNHLTGTPAAGDLEQATDATRRTWLAQERTYLAWWRTALTTFAVALGAGRVVPALTKAGRLPYALLGAGFGALGVFLVVYGRHRQRIVDRALERGEFIRADDRVLSALTVIALVLGLGVIVLVATET
jgi:putative membrane protein